MKKALEKILLKITMSEALDEGDLKQVERLILTATIQGLLIQRVGLWLFSNNTQGISCKLLIDSHQQTKTEHITLYREDYPLYFQELDIERTIRANNALTDPNMVEFVDNYLIPNNITSKLDVSIRFQGKMVGILCCEYIKQPHSWSDDEVIFVTALANMYSLALIIAEKNEYKTKLEQLNNVLEEKIQIRTNALEGKIIELEQTQEALIQSKKMAALGNLVAGIAHEINTPLGIAITSNSWLNDQLNEIDLALTQETLSQSTLNTFIERAKTSVEISVKNLKRAAQLVADFKQTAVNQSGYEVATINLQSFLKTLLAGLKPMIKEHNIDIMLLCNESIKLSTYPGAIAQVITNLMFNVCHHAFSDEHDRLVYIEVEQHKSRGQVLLTFSDNGIGMSEEVVEKAIEPFYTTKRGKGGVGLGLSIAYNLVLHQLRGQFSLISQENEGTRVLITLPDLNK